MEFLLWISVQWWILRRRQLTPRCLRATTPQLTDDSRNLFDWPRHFDIASSNFVLGHNPTPWKISIKEGRIVFEGHQPGIYEPWPKVKYQVNGFYGSYHLVRSQGWCLDKISTSTLQVCFQEKEKSYFVFYYLLRMHVSTYFTQLCIFIQIRNDIPNASNFVWCAYSNYLAAYLIIKLFFLFSFFSFFHVVSIPIWFIITILVFHFLNFSLLGSIHFLLAVVAILNWVSFISTRRHYFLYLAVAFTLSLGIYLGNSRTKIKTRFNIRVSISFVILIYHHFFNSLFCVWDFNQKWAMNVYNILIRLDVAYIDFASNILLLAGTSTFEVIYGINMDIE